jgi:hypothetical protein
MSAETSVPSDSSIDRSTDPVAVRKSQLAFAVVVAGVLGWLAYTWAPTVWTLSEELQNFGPLPSVSEQDQVHAAEHLNLWKNSSLRFALTGLAIAASSLVFYGSRIGRHLPAIATVLICGLAFGAIAGGVGLPIRNYLDRNPIPVVSEEARPLFADGLMFALLSVHLLLPIAILLWLQPARTDRQRGWAVPFAGLLTGILLPVASALMLSSYVKTDDYPPGRTELTVLWFTMMTLMTLLVVTSTGARKRSTAEGAHAHTAS